MRWRLLLLVLLLVACAAPEAPPVVFVGTEWRTASGGMVTRGEIEALQAGCGPRTIAAPFDPDRPGPLPLHDNPAYRPGGEGLINAAPSGLASAGNAVAVEHLRRRLAPPLLPDDCLKEHGLLRSP